MIYAKIRLYGDTKYIYCDSWNEYYALAFNPDTEILFIRVIE